MQKILAFFLLAFFSLKAQDIIVQFSFENGENFSVKMEQNKAAQDFISRLPMSFKLNDYGGKEKVSHLQNALQTPKKSPKNSEYEPQIGDFFYYAPLQNIGLYYEAQSPFDGLYKLGEIIEKDGVEMLKKQKEDFILKAEVIKQK